MADLGIEYVVLLNVAHNERYDFLYDQPELIVVMETEDVIVFHNAAFTDAPPPDEWPDDGSGVPVLPLGIGTAITIVSIGWIGSRKVPAWRYFARR